MTTVGKETQKDIEHIFKKLKNGMNEINNKLEKPICHWNDCNETFKNMEELYQHMYRKHTPNESSDILYH